MSHKVLIIDDDPAVHALLEIASGQLEHGVALCIRTGNPGLTDGGQPKAGTSSCSTWTCRTSIGHEVLSAAQVGPGHAEHPRAVLSAAHHGMRRIIGLDPGRCGLHHQAIRSV